MGEHFFLSYSAVDGAEFALSLADKLAAGPPPYPVWLDRRELHAGMDWDEQIVEALRTCRGLLFVLTEDSVTPESVCKQEWVRALSYKKPVIPLRLHADAELPFRLGSRQFIHFSDFDTGLARLRDHLAWTSTPAGVLQELRTRRSDAQRQLPRAVPERQPLIEREIEDLTRQIDAQQQLVEHPVDAEEQTTQRIAAGLERERQPERPVSAAPRARFVNPPPMTAPTYFQGRETETALVADYLRTPGLRMTTVVGRGGVGKTALVCRLLKALESSRLPDGLGELNVNGIVYLSPVGAHPVNFPNLFADLCRLLPDDTAERLRQRYRDADPPPFTQHALRHQGADYFEQTRTPRETWKTLDDVAPQLAEFDLRCQAQDYDTAANVLQGIDYSLTLWGHYRLTIDLHQRLQGHLTDPWTKHTHLSQLGSCYLHIGQIPTAIDHHQQALTISRVTGDQLGEASELGCLGGCYAHLGQTTKAIDHHQQALAISRDTGDRAGEGTHLGNLANCYSDLGQIPTALGYYQQALTISRDTGFPEGEATDLGNLGSRYADLGQTTKAIDHHQRALTIAQDIGDQKGNAHYRLMLGDDLADQGGWPASIEQYRQAIQIADEIGYAQVQCEGRLSLAQVRLLTGDPEACRATAKDATAYDYPPKRPQVHLLFGIAQLRQGEHPDARQSLTKAVEHADEQLQHTPENYYALDCKALASCGLALDGQPDHLADAIAAFRAARAITTAPGIVARTLRLLDAIAASDSAGLLTAARAAAQGRE